MKRNNIIEEIFNSMTPEERKESEERVEEQLKWIDEHSDWNERYGTDKSYFLEEIKSQGFTPIAITTMCCEETFVFKTEEERRKVADMFLPEGFYYCLSEWKESRGWYVEEMYDGDYNKAPKVYCLDDEFKKFFEDGN